MCGWVSRARVLASSRIQCAFGSVRTFTATGRDSRSSYPRHTVDEPPRATCSMRRYRPSSSSVMVGLYPSALHVRPLTHHNPYAAPASLTVLYGRTRFSTVDGGPGGAQMTQICVISVI